MNSSLINKRIKLFYFKLNAKASTPRAILYYKNIKFEDIYITRDQWPELKKTKNFEFGQMPLLTIDDKNYLQTFAINIYLAKNLNLYGKSIEEEYLINSLLCSSEDVQPKFRGIIFHESEGDRKKAEKDFLEIHAPFYLNVFESRLKKFGGKYMIGDNFSVADIFITVYLYNIFLNKNRSEAFPKTLKQNAPKLNDLIKTISENELHSYFKIGYLHDSLI